MTDQILVHEGDLLLGRIVERENRFVLLVNFPRETERQRVFLGDPGELAFLNTNSQVLCEPISDPSRKTQYDAVAGKDGGVWVSLKAALANTLFAELVRTDRLPLFADFNIKEKEPSYPTHGRGDFLLERAGASDNTVFVEVKSCTHVESRRAMFPDRPTERGRRHLQALLELQEQGKSPALVFVVQRPDVEIVEPFHEVDPEFAEYLREAVRAGITVTAVSIRFDPPVYELEDPELEIHVE